MRPMKKLLLVAAALAVASAAAAETTLLQSMPSKVRKEVEDVRASCKEADLDSVTEGGYGLVEFKLSGNWAVLVDHSLLCGGCRAGVNCSNRGTRGVAIYMRRGDKWVRVFSDEDAQVSITGDIFISLKPGKKEDLNALVLSFFSGN